jgi:hypothetical protein
VNDDMIALVVSFAAGLVIGAAIAAMIARDVWRTEMRGRFPVYKIPDYESDKFISRCPKCGDHYVYPPTCKPGYCAKEPKLALVKTRGGTPGKDILE